MLKYLDYEVFVKLLETKIAEFAIWTRLPVIKTLVDQLIRFYIADPLFKFLSIMGAHFIIQFQVGQQGKAANDAKAVFINSLSTGTEADQLKAKAEYEAKLEALIKWNKE